MKRSEINAVIKKFEALLAEYKFALPPYLSFTPEEWAEKVMSTMRFVTTHLVGM